MPPSCLVRYCPKLFRPRESRSSRCGTALAEAIMARGSIRSSGRLRQTCPTSARRWAHSTLKNEGWKGKGGNLDQPENCPPASLRPKDSRSLRPQFFTALDGNRMGVFCT